MRAGGPFGTGSPVAGRGLDQLTVALASGITFVASARMAASRGVGHRERRAFRAINSQSSALRVPAWLVMQAGSLPAVGVVAALASRRSRSGSVAVAIAGPSVWAFCKLAKRVVGRGRPADHLDDVVVRGREQRGGGFPSGHAAVATTLASISSRVVAPPAASLLWGASALVCGARPYVGAHLPLDVVGGASLGLSAGAVANIALDRTRRRR